MPAYTLAKREVERAASWLLADFSQLPGFKTGAKVVKLFALLDPKTGEVGFYEVKFSAPDQPDAGYAILSATTDNQPILEFSDRGLTHHERFLRMTGRRSFRMFYFSPNYITAEDTDGNLLAEIGRRPVIVPPELRTKSRREMKGTGDFTPPAKNPTVARLVTSKPHAVAGYKEFKKLFVAPTMKAAKLELSWRPYLNRTPNPGGCSYDFYWADGAPNQTYFLQLAPNSPPNTNGHYSGCGPTAWLNLLGWHDRNWAPSVLSGNQQFNNAYTNDLTMQCHDYVGTYEPWWTFGADQGFTWPDDMLRGVGFVRDVLRHHCSWWMRQDWFDTDEEWVFEVARHYARMRRPFIVGYFEDWHYAIGLGIAECRTHGWEDHSWIRIYPAWSPNNSQDKWITKNTIYAVYGATDFRSMSSVSLENPQELEVGVSGPGDTNRMLIYSGIGVCNSIQGTGANWTRGPISFEVGRSLSPAQFRGATVQVGLASISNKDEAVNGGWAVDRAHVERDSNSGRSRVYVDYAVRDSDGFLHRLSYRVTVLAKL